MHKTETGQIIFEDNWEVIDYVSERFRRAESWDGVVSRLSEFHSYVKTNCMPDAWGKNIFHSVLDDAIKLRERVKTQEELIKQYRKMLNDYGHSL